MRMHSDAETGREQRRSRETPAQAPARPVVPSDPTSFVLALERLGADPRRLDEYLAEGLRAGLVGAADVQRIEALVGGRAASRALHPEVADRLGREVGVDPRAVRVSAEMPGAFLRAGMSAAAVGATVVAPEGTLQEEQGVGLALLRHELTHVRQHLDARTPAAIHFDAGRTAAEGQARAAQTRVDPNAAEEIEAVRRAHGAEAARVREILGSLIVTDGDVHRVLRVLSHWDSDTITSFWRGLPGRFVERLFGELDASHFRQQPREMLASARALTVQRRFQLIREWSSTGLFNGVNETEALAIFWVLQGLPRSSLEAFMQLDGGDSYRAYRRSLPADARQRLEAGINPQLEAQLRRQEEGRRRDAAAEEEARRQQAVVNGVVGRCRELLSTGFTDWAVTDGDARRVFQILSGLADEAALGAAVRDLEATGHMAVWVDNLPAAEAYRRPDVRHFLRIVRHRPPEAAIEQAMGLLSYGLFDWAVTDAEAVVAYHLIRGLPPSAQHAFRMRDGNQWFVRMERNLTGDVLTGREGAEGGYGLIDGGGEADVARQERERADDTATVQQHQPEVEALAQRIRDANATTAPGVLADLCGDGGARCRAFTRHLERLGLVVRLLDRLGDARWAPDNRHKTLAVMRHRDPAHNLHHIRELLTTWLFDWEITAPEARLAYECIRALPPETRRQFIAMEPEWFAAMDENISRELRESEDFGLYDGRASGDRAALLGQLLEPELWQASSLGRLRMVLHMVRQAGERQAAAPHVQRHFADSDAHRQLFVELGYAPDGRLVPEQVIDRTDANTLRLIGAALGTLVDTEHASSFIFYALGFRDSGSLRGLPLDRAQDMFGGHLMGVRVAQVEHTEDAADQQDAAELDALVDEERGLVEAEIASLPIENINLMMGSNTLRTGRAQVTGLRLRVKWATDVDPETSFVLSLGGLEVSDAMLVQEDRLYGVGRIALSGLEIRGERPDPQVVERGDSTLADVMKALGRVVEVVFMPLTLPLGLSSLLRDFGGLVETIRTSFSEHVNLRLSLGSLVVQDVVDSRGGHVEQLGLGGVELDIVTSPLARVRQQLAELRRAGAGAADPARQAQLAQLEAEERELAEAERRLEALRQRRADPSLDAERRRADEEEIQALSRRVEVLEVQGSVRGGLHVQGANMGGLEAERLEVGDLTVSGRAEGVDALAGLTDRGALTSDARAAGLRPDDETTPAMAGALTVTAGTVSGEGVAFGSTQPRHLALDAIIAELAPRLSAGTLNEDDRTRLEAAQRERRALTPHVARLAQLQERFATLNETERREYLEIQGLLRQPPSLRVERLALTNASIDVDPTGPAVGLRADGASLEGLELGGVQVGSLSASGLQLGYDGSGDGSATVAADEAVLGQVDQVGRLERLRARRAALEALEVRSPRDEGELRGVVEQLALYERLAAEVAELTARWDAVPEGERGSAESVALRQRLARRASEKASWEGGAHADAVEVRDAHLRIGGLTTFAETGGGLTVEGRQEEGEANGRMAGEVTLRGVRQGDTSVEQVTLRDLGGQVRIVTPDHYRVEGLRLGSLTVAGIDARGGGSHVQVREQVQLSGLEVSLDLRWHQVREGAALVRRIERVEVPRLRLDELRGRGIDATTASGRFHLRDGALRGIHVTDLVFDGASGTTTFGRVAASGLTLEDLRAHTADGLRASVGSLRTGDIAVSSVQAGAYTIDIDAIFGDDIRYDAEGMGLTVANLSGGSVRGLEYDTNSGRVVFPNIHLDALTLSRASWSAPPKHLGIGTRLTARGVDIAGRANLRTEAERRSPDEGALESLDLASVVIREASFQGLTYRDDALGRQIEVRSGSLANLRVTNLHLDASALTARVDLGSSRLEGIDAAIGEAMRVRGDLAFDGFGIDLLRSGGMALDIDNLSTPDLQLQLGTRATGINVVNLAGSTGIYGRVEMEGQTTRLRRFELGDLRLSQLDWRAGGMRLRSSRAIGLYDVRFDAELVQGTDEAGESVLERASVSRLHVGLVDVEHLTASDGDSTFTINREMQESGSLVVVNIDVDQLDWTPGGGLIGSPMTISHVGCHELGVQIGADLRAQADLDAHGIQVQFLQGGRIRTRVSELDLAVEGEQGGTEFGARLEGADTGEIEVGPNEITVPGLRIPTLTLSRMAMDSDAMGFRLQPGGQVRLTSIAADLTVHRRPNPTRGQSSIDRIVVRRLHVPAVTASGFELDLKSQGLQVSLGAEHTGTVSDLLVEDYVVQAPATPDGTWRTSGRASTGAIDLPRLRLAMSGTQFFSDLAVRSIAMRELSDGRRTIDVMGVTADNVEGQTGGSRFGVQGIDVASVRVQSDEDGSSTTVGETSVRGLTYSDGNVTLEIASAALPDGVQLPASGPVTIPELTIQQAQLRIGNLGALAGGGGGEAGPGVDMSFLDSLQGHLNFRLVVTYFLDHYGLRNLRRTVELPIRNGAIDFASAEDQILGGLEDAAVDFEFDDDTGLLRLEVDYVVGHSDLIHWSLDEEGQELAERDRIRLRDLARARMVPSDSDGDSPIELFYANIEDIDARLDIRRPTTIDLGPRGRIHLLEDGLVGLTARGAIRTSGSGNHVASALNLGLAEANARLENLNLNGALLNLEHLHLGPITDVSIGFRSFNPQAMSGTLTSARARNIRVTLPPSGGGSAPRRPRR